MIFSFPLITSTLYIKVAVSK